MSLLELRNVHSAYGNVQALRGLSLHVDRGEIVTLLGANGAGKSTTLRTISGLVQATDGEVLLEGKPITRASPEAISRMGIAHVPEGRRIFPGLTVHENIMIGTSNRGRLPRKQMESEVAQMYEIFPDLKRMTKALGHPARVAAGPTLTIASGADLTIVAAASEKCSSRTPKPCSSTMRF